jgi:hypothetical protein
VFLGHPGNGHRRDGNRFPRPTLPRNQTLAGPDVERMPRAAVPGDAEADQLDPEAPEHGADLLGPGLDRLGAPGHHDPAGSLDSFLCPSGPVTDERSSSIWSPGGSFSLPFSLPPVVSGLKTTTSTSHPAPVCNISFLHFASACPSSAVFALSGS